MNGRPCAGKRHRDHVEILRPLEAFGKKVTLRSDAPVGVVSIRSRPQIRDQFFCIADGQGRMCGDNVRRRDREVDGDKVGDGIIWKIAEHRRIHHMGAQGEQDRVAVWIGPRHLCRAAVAGCACDIFHDELLPELLREMRAGETRIDVNRAAWRKGDDGANRPHRIRLRQDDARRREHCGGRAGETHKAAPVQRS